MTNTNDAGTNAPANRRARVAVFGEFSAGKSTFINLITGGRMLRTQVTATQMPAVWMSYGADLPYRVGIDGSESPVDLSDLSSISVDDTAYIRVFMRTPVLEICDLIDTPGSSDPNIAPIAWERIAAIADVAVWCSPSTQAWRQSEAASWSEMPERLRQNSVLLLTRADKLTTDTDREKVLRRVTNEAGHLFTSVHMGSLLNLEAVQAPFREVIGLCRAVDATQTPGAMDTAQILRAMGVAAETASSKQIEAKTEAKADQAFADIEAEANTAPQRQGAEAETPFMDGTMEDGFATMLWHRLTEGLPPGDDEALDRAFTRFLTRLDREVAALREITNIGKVG